MWIRLTTWGYVLTFDDIWMVKHLKWNWDVMIAKINKKRKKEKMSWKMIKYHQNSHHVDVIKCHEKSFTLTSWQFISWYLVTCHHKICCISWRNMLSTLQKSGKYVACSRQLVSEQFQIGFYRFHALICYIASSIFMQCVKIF